MKLSGSAPYLSWLASSLALDWVKMPLIWVVPPLIADWLYRGGETWPSRVKATKSAHGTEVRLQLLGFGVTWPSLLTLCAPV